MKPRIRNMSTDEIKLRLARVEKSAPKVGGKPLLGLRGLSYRDALSQRREK